MSHRPPVVATTRLFVAERERDWQELARLDPGDRGLAYGDGVFETLRVAEGVPVWWDRHIDRLERGADRLAMAAPDRAWLRLRVDALIAGVAAGVVKIILTRGVGGRGYRPPMAAEPVLVLSCHPLPEPPPAGLRLRWCRLRLAAQPALAGIKHLNRLEQVLARLEWDDPDIHEGLLCDGAGAVVSAISGNLFVRRAGRWLTPAIRDCGIEGVCRAWLLDTLRVEIADLRPNEVETADTLFVCNSVRGILPVAALAERQWRPDPEILALRRRLALDWPAFAADLAADPAFDLQPDTP